MKKLLYTYKDNGTGLSDEWINSYSFGILADLYNRTIYGGNSPIAGNHYRGSYHGEIHNDYDKNIAFGDYSSAFGKSTQTNGKYSAAFGENVKTTNDHEFAVGKNNVSTVGTLFSVGNGKSSFDKSNAISVSSNGVTYMQSGAYIAGRNVNSYIDSAYSYLTNSYNNLHTYFLSSYSYTKHFANLSHSYTLASYNSIRNAYNSLKSYMLNAYNFSVSSYLASKSNGVEHRDLTTTGHNIDATYVSSIGKSASMSILMSALLEEAQYTYPSISLSIIPNNTVEVGYVSNIGVKINVANTNSTKGNTYGLSYGLNSCSFVDPNSNTVSWKTTYFNTGLTYPYISGYSFSKEQNYNIFSKAKFSYYEASYKGYPQLLDKKGLFIASKEKWFGPTSYEMYVTNPISINAKYKIYYGWDETPDPATFNGASNYVWMNSGSGSTTVTSNIAFTSNHTKLWIAYPDFSSLITTNGFKVLYHTAIGDSDLVSSSATTDTVTTTNNVRNYGLKYRIYRINFNGTINGATGNYIKFTVQR